MIPVEGLTRPDTRVLDDSGDWSSTPSTVDVFAGDEDRLWGMFNWCQQNSKKAWQMGRFVVNHRCRVGFADEDDAAAFTEVWA